MWLQWTLLMLVAVFLGGCLSLVVGMGFWLAFSNRRPAFRLAGVLVAVTYLAFTFDLSQSTPQRIVIFVMAMLLVGIGWAFSHVWIRAIVAAIGIGLGVWWITQSDSWQTTNWASAIPLGMPVLTVACCMFGLRMSGFRVVKLTGKFTDREVEIGTGRTIDEWVGLYFQESQSPQRREDVIRFAREDGVPFAWQRVVADAIDVVAGQTLIGMDESRRPQIIADKASLKIAAIVSPREGRFRWSIAQIMFLSVAVAVVAAVIRALEVPIPDPLELFFLVAIPAALAIAGWAIAYALLRLNRNRRIDLACTAIVLAISSAVYGICLLYPALVGFAAILMQYVLFIYGSFVITFAMGIILVRHHGYRLVLVGRARSTSNQPTAAPLR